LEETKSILSSSNDSSRDGLALASLILGLVNLCSWFLPLVAYPLTIAGLITGGMGLSSTKNKTMAIVGLVLSSLSLLLTCGNSVLGVLISTGQF
jgi:hypothetical protein